MQPAHAAAQNDAVRRLPERSRALS